MRKLRGKSLVQVNHQDADTFDSAKPYLSPVAILLTFRTSGCEGVGVRTSGCKVMVRSDFGEEMRAHEIACASGLPLSQ